MQTANVIRMGLGALAANLFGRRRPLNLMVSVTNRCTAHCRYCRIPDRVQREMTTEELVRLIDEAVALGTRRIGLWGGEPLMRDDIGRIVSHAAGRGLFVTMDTNGHRLQDRLDEVAEASHIVVALDGDRAAHDAVRGRGTFDLALAGLRAALGRVPVWTITVLTRQNLDQVDFLLDLARREGFLCTFQVIHHTETLGEAMGPFLADAAAYRDAARRLIAAKRAGAPIASSIPYLKHLLRWPDYAVPTMRERVGRLRCWAGRLYANVDTDGLVYPCSLMIGRMPARNFLEVGLKAAFAALQDIPCAACDASCFTEYNYLYSLSPRVIVSWLRAMRRTRRLMRERAGK